MLCTVLIYYLLIYYELENHNCKRLQIQMLRPLGQSRKIEML